MLAGVPEFISGHFPDGLRWDGVHDGGGGSSGDAATLPPEADVVMVRHWGHSHGTSYTLG
jgi:hypothetical protein